MVSGMEKYFQIARCFRDEDLRADRQPEFTQLDIEMSFVEREQLYELMEEMMAHIFQKTLGKKVTTPFLRMTYDEAMGRFGSDKPDLRFGMELKDITAIAQASAFQVFASIASSGGQVKGINAAGCAKYSRKDIDDLTKIAAIFGAKGLAYLIVEENGVKSPIAKFFTEEQLLAVCQTMDAKCGDLLLFVAADPLTVAESLGHLRLEVAKRENLVDADALCFLWVTDFPLLEFDKEENRWAAMHHPFTSPRDEDLAYLESDPRQSKSQSLRHDFKRHGIRRRQHPYFQSGNPGKNVCAAWFYAGRSTRQIRLSLGCV